ncbi:MAG: ROK family transcriptional regulator [Caulobacteraceae bacterium]|nr:ROK family transcriptional regulator [Caulobacteraceae bacterium]
MVHASQSLGSDLESEKEIVLQPGVSAVASGADQSGVRAYNERLLLSLVRRFGPLSKIEVARLTGLSVQSTSAIMNRLQAEGLLRREAPLRGRVGQPTVPLSLDPEGAFSLGLKVGRRSCDLILIDFRGAIRKRIRRTFAFPTPAMVLDFVRSALPAVVETLDGARRKRVAGLGVAMPFQLWAWEAEIGAPAGAMQAWRGFDVERSVEPICPYPVTLCNDATAACGAEFVFGRSWRYRDFIYFYVGAFVGGGIVLDGALRTGRTGNAGALGSMPIARKGDSAVAQLIAQASIAELERRLDRAGVNPSAIWATPEAWPDFGVHLDAWIEDVASALAHASLAALSVIDFEAVVIDGAMPVGVRDRLATRARDVFVGLDHRGLSDATLVAGTIGPDARSLGAAALPLIRNFGRDREVLLKDAVAEAR